MTQRNTVIRSLHELSLAAWFGGNLAGVIGINGAADAVPEERERLRAANAGWTRWSRVLTGAVAVHLATGAALGYGNKGRVLFQKGVGASTIAKTALTAAAVGATAWSAVLGKQLEAATGAPVEGSTEPAPATPPDVERAQRRMRVAQWTVPVLTGAVVVLNAVHGEQQRPSQVLPGLLRKPAELLRAAA